MGATPTLEHQRSAPRLVAEVNAPSIVSRARCENCGSPNVLSRLVTSTAIYWRCQKCDEISVTDKGPF